MSQPSHYKRSGNRWSTDNCRHCGGAHLSYESKFTTGAEIVVCRKTQKIVVLPDNWRHMNVKV